MNEPNCDASTMYKDDREQYRLAQGQRLGVLQFLFAANLKVAPEQRGALNHRGRLGDCGLVALVAC